jgi:hypothetical protein
MIAETNVSIEKSITGTAIDFRCSFVARWRLQAGMAFERATMICRPFCFFKTKLAKKFARECTCQRFNHSVMIIHEQKIDVSAIFRRWNTLEENRSLEVHVHYDSVFKWNNTIMKTISQIRLK